MKRFFVVLFVLCSIMSLAQADRPSNLSFNGLADFIRNFDFIASYSSMPEIVGSQGVQYLDWSNASYPELMISNGESWIKLRGKEYNSAGAVLEPSFTDNEDGTITVDACCVVLFDNALFVGNPKPYNFDIATFTLEENKTNYIVANHNDGSPEIQNITDVSLINESTVTPIFTIFYHDGHIHSLNWDTLGLGLSNKLHQRLVKTNRFALESGLTLTHTDLTFSIASGTIWYGGAKKTLNTHDSETDSTFIVFANGDMIATDSFCNHYYESENALVEANPSRYVVNWIYRSVDTENYCYIVLGQADYKLLEARDSIPSVVPQFIETQAVLVANVIVKVDSTEEIYVHSMLKNGFTMLAPQIHNDLLGLNEGDYLHLTPIEYSQALIGTDSVDYTVKTLSFTEGIYAPYAKYHRIATMTLAEANTWTDVEWDFNPEAETSFGMDLISSSTIEIASASLIQINGCVRPRWQGAANSDVIVASRIVYSFDNGANWEEARCLQMVDEHLRQSDEVGVKHYMGSIHAQDNTRVKLQVLVSNTSMVFSGWPEFDNPVSMTINLFISGL